MTDKLIKFFMILIDLDDIEDKMEIIEDSDYIDDDFEYISNTDSEK